MQTIYPSLSSQALKYVHCWRHLLQVCPPQCSLASLPPFTDVPVLGVKSVRGKHLEFEFKEQRQRLKTIVAGQYTTLSVDGWTSPTGVALVGLAVDKYLVGLVEESVRHTGEELSVIAKKFKPALENEFSMEVVAVVTDGASNMELMRGKLKESFPKLIAVRCQAHALHLCIQDLFKDSGRDSILKKVLMVLKTFRATHLLTAELRKLGLPRPPLPAATRWGSCCNSLTYYNKNWAYLAQIAASNLTPSNPVRQALEQSQLCRGVLDLLHQVWSSVRTVVFHFFSLSQVVPITKALDLMQRENTTLGEALCIWLELEERLPPRCAALTIVRNRGEQAKTPEFCAGHALDIRLPALPGMVILKKRQPSYLSLQGCCSNGLCNSLPAKGRK